MYEIRKGGEVLALAETPNFIYQHPEGFYVLCERAVATGVAVNGIPYSLHGTTGIKGREEVLLVERDTGELLKNTENVSGIMFVTMAEAGGIDDTTAGEHIDLFEEWTYPITYKPGQLRRDPLDGKLYRLNDSQGHTSQEGWNPSLTPALWTLAADPSEKWPAWSQPIGKDDAYKLDARVTHNSKRWICTEVDGAGNNVWEPGVYGWTEYTE